MNRESSEENKYTEQVEPIHSQNGERKPTKKGQKRHAHTNMKEWVEQTNIHLMSETHPQTEQNLQTHRQKVHNSISEITHKQ